MGSQAHTEAPLTRRQIAARKRAERTKAVNAAAKAWLASRKDSQTPAADRLIARHIGKGWNEASAREILHSCLRSESENNFGRFETSYCFAEGVAYQLMRYGLISQRNNVTNVVAFMQEAGVPAQYWEREAAQLARAKEAAQQERQRRRPGPARTVSADELAAEQARMARIAQQRVQLPLIAADEPATVDSDLTVTPAGAETETVPDNPPPSVPVVAGAELKRATGQLVRMGQPPYDGAIDDLAQESVSREKGAVDNSRHQANSHQHSTDDHGNDATEAVCTRVASDFIASPRVNDLSVRVINPFTQPNKKAPDSQEGQRAVWNDQQRNGKRQNKQPNAQQYQHFVPVFQRQISKMFEPFVQWRPRVLYGNDACRSLHLAFKHVAPSPISFYKRRAKTRSKRHRRTRISPKPTGLARAA